MRAVKEEVVVPEDGVHRRLKPRQYLPVRESLLCLKVHKVPDKQDYVRIAGIHSIYDAAYVLALCPKGSKVKIPYLAYPEGL